MIIKHGLDRKFWSLKAEDLAALDKIKTEVFEFRKLLTEKLGDDDWSNPHSLPPEQYADSLRKNQKFQQVRSVFYDEASFAHKKLEEIATIAKRLTF